MNDIFSSRRSIRAYTSESVSEAELTQIVEAAGYAPSGANSQQWQFFLVTGDSLEFLRVAVRDCFRSLCLTEQHPPFFAKCKEWAVDDNWSFFYNAPAMLIVANKADYRNAAADSAAAAENACLKATELGLGSCWSTTLSGVNDCPEVASAMKKLGLNNGYRVFASVILGHAAENPSAAPRKYQLIRKD